MDSSAGEQCVICYEELDRELSAAPCGHVFHSVCIDKWHKSGTFCPMCHARLPAKLLRLFFDPKQATGDGPNCGVVHSGTAASCDSASNPTEPNAAGGGRAGRAGEASADVVRLRRELASITKVNDMNKEAAARHKQQLAEARNKLLDSKAAHVATKSELEGAVVVSKAELQTAKIDLCKKSKENNRLKREMLEVGERLRKFQGEKTAHDFLSQVASQVAGARSLNGLGQVDIEQILRQVAQGTARADTVIRGQYDLLSGSMEREQKTKRELRKSKAETDAAALELRDLRSKLVRSKKEVLRLEKAFSKALGELHGKHASPPTTGALAGSAKRSRPSMEAGATSSVPSRPASRPDGKGIKRPAPTSWRADCTGASATNGGFSSAKRRNVEVEENDGMVSLGSDDDGDSDSEGEEESGASGKRGTERATRPLVSRDQMGRDALISPAISSRSFLGAAAGGGGTKQKPGKFIRSGFNAMGGRHNVRSNPGNRFGLDCKQGPPVARSS